MDVRILGALEASVDGRAIDLGIRQARSLFAVLATQPGVAVRATDLAEALWPGGPPPRWEATVQSHVSRLRRALEPDRPPRAPATRLVTHGDAYVLQLSEGELDAQRFEAAAAQGRAALAAGDHQRAVEHLDLALGEWRGHALSGFPNPAFLATEIARLEELRVLTQEERAEAALALGRHREAVADLEALVAEHPFRERGWELLLLALYRSGRQSEAVRRYQEVRGLLVEELGIEPGPALRSLEVGILRHDPGLAPTTAPAGEGAPGAVELPLPAWLRAPDDEFVGRARDLAVVDAAFDAVAAGGRRLVLVLGEPGIGKTRLLREAARELHDRGGLVVGGRCVEGPLHVLEAFAEAVGRLAPNQADRLEREAPGDLAVLAGLVPELSRRVAPVTAVDAESHRYLLFRAVSDLLDGRHVGRTIVLVLDDLHWAPPAALQLLAHLLRDEERGPLLVLASARGSEPTEALSALVADLHRDRRIDQVGLTGLGVEEVDALVAARGHGGAGGGLYDMAEGNPFFVEELVRHVVESGGSVGPDDLPESVRDTIARRLLRLPERTRRALGVAALAGRDFRLDVVARAAGLDVDAADDALEAASRAGLVVEAVQPAGLFSFTHALIPAVLRDGLGGARRARVHRRFGEALVELGGPNGEVARHLLAAAEDGSDAVPGIEAALVAARDAVECFTYDDAVVVLESAWSAASTRQQLDASLVCRVALTLARTLLRSGGYERRDELLEHAWSRSREAGSAELSAEVIVEACAGTVRPAEPWPTRAEEVVGRLDESAPGRVLLTAILCHLRSSEPGDRARGLAEWAMARVSMLEPVQRRAVTEYCLAVIGASSPIERVVDLARGSLADARAAGNLFEVIEALSVLRRVELAAADVAAYEATTREYEAAVSSARIPRFMAGVEQRRAMMASLAGRFSEAEAHAHEAVALQPLAEFMEGLAVQLFAIRFEQGRLDEVRSAVEEWAAQADRPAWVLGLAVLRAELGETRGAGEILAPFVADGFSTVPRDDLYFLSLCVAARTATSIRDVAAAAVLYELLSPHGSRVVVAGEGALCWGSVHRFLGPLSALVGNGERASMHFEASMSIHERLGANPFLARDRLAYASLLRAQGGDPLRIRELTRTGLALAERLGMASVVARHAEGR